MRVLLSASLLLAAACDQAPFEPPALYRPSVLEWVTPELALQLDADGRFLPMPAAAPPFDIIDEVFAADLAEAFARMAGPSNAEQFRRVIGASVPFDQLRTMDIFLGQTPHEPLLVEGARPAAYRQIGPQYLALLGTEQGIWVSVAVSALNHHLRLVDGLIEFPVYQGGEFWMAPFAGERIVETAERATELAARAGGRHAVERPTFVLGPQFGAGSLAVLHGKWRVVLDRPVIAQLASSGVRQSDTLYVGNGGRLYMSAEEQPAEDVFHVVMLDGTQNPVTISRVTDRPVRFVEIASVVN